MKKFIAAALIFILALLGTACTEDVIGDTNSDSEWKYLATLSETDVEDNKAYGFTFQDSIAKGEKIKLECSALNDSKSGEEGSVKVYFVKATEDVTTADGALTADLDAAIASLTPVAEFKSSELTTSKAAMIGAASGLRLAAVPMAKIVPTATKEITVEPGFYYAVVVADGVSEFSISVEEYNG